MSDKPQPVLAEYRAFTAEARQFAEGLEKDELVRVFTTQAWDMKKLADELKQERLTICRLSYEKFWALGEDGQVDPDFELLAKDLKDKRIDLATYRYLLEGWGCEDMFYDPAWSPDTPGSDNC